jgi:predicted esterase
LASEEQEEMTEHQILLEFPLYYDLFLPEGRVSYPLIVATHGYGGDKSSMMKLARKILGDEFAIAALQGPHQHMNMNDGEPGKRRFGFGWLTNFKPEESVALHHAAIEKIIVDAPEGVDRSSVFLFGFSQSVGANFRFAFTRPHLVKGVIGVCGGIPGDWEVEGKYASGVIDVLYIAAERDEFYSTERIRGYAKALGKRARSVNFQMFDSTHEVPRDSYELIREWLQVRCTGL